MRATTELASRRVALAALVVASSFVGSCTLTRPARDACETNVECREAFGFGSTCGPDGLCRRAEAHPRCTRTFPPGLASSANEAGTIVFGSIVDQSVETHQARENAIQLAVSEVRDQDGIGGTPVGVVFCTNQVDPALDELDQATASAEIARYLADELGVPVILGPPSSASAQAVFEAVESSGVLVISPSATSAALTALEGPATDDAPGRLWRTAPPDALQARVIADDLTMRGVTEVAVIAQVGPYGQGLADELEASFEGGVTRFSFDSASGRNTAATDAGSSDAQEVLFISSQTSDATGFVLFAESFAGYDGKNIFLTDSAANMDFLTDAAAASALFARIRGTRPAAPTGLVFDAFVGAYAAENDGADVRLFSFTAHSYDAAWIALYGASWATLRPDGPLSGTTVARGMRRLSAGPPFDARASSYPMILERFRLGESVDIRGASGDLNFDPSTEETSSPIEVWQVGTSGASFEAIYAVTP